MACAVRPTNIGNALAKLDLDTGAVYTFHVPGGVTGKCRYGLGSAAITALVHANAKY